MSNDTHCKRCGEFYDLRDGCEPTDFCDLCAQTILARLLEITPKPPKTIAHVTDYDRSIILRTLQEELHGPML